MWNLSPLNEMLVYGCMVVHEWKFIHEISPKKTHNKVIRVHISHVNLMAFAPCHHGDMYHVLGEILVTHVTREHVVGGRSFASHTFCHRIWMDFNGWNENVNELYSWIR
jgi:hypothetical protein